MLLGLAAGGIARQLGARRHWPLAGFLVLVTPTVVRFAATQYVDIFLAAVLLGAGFFAIRWMRAPRWGERRPRRRRPRARERRQAARHPLRRGSRRMAVLGAVISAPGTQWGKRAAHRARPPDGPGARQLLLRAERRLRRGPARHRLRGAGGGRPPKSAMPELPRPDSVLDRWRTVGQSQVLDAFLGITRPQSDRDGRGPAGAAPARRLPSPLPFALPRGVRREGWLVAVQIVLRAGVLG